MCLRSRCDALVELAGRNRALYAEVARELRQRQTHLVADVGAGDRLRHVGCLELRRRCHEAGQYGGSDAAVPQCYAARESTDR